MTNTEVWIGFLLILIIVLPLPLLALVNLKQQVSGKKSNKTEELNFTKP